MALRPLPHPPILEAICEFRFAHPISVGPQLGGDLHALGFSAPPSKWKGNEVFIDQSTSPIAAQVRTSERDQYRRPDGSMMVQVGENVLVVNHSRPYVAWDAYLVGIMAVLKAFVDHGGGGALGRLGLRYLNRLNLTPPHARVRDLLRIFGLVGGPFDGIPMRGFYQRYDLAHLDPEGILTLQVGVATDQGGPHLVLDLDFGSPFAPGPPYTPFDVPAWLSAAHERVEEAFVASLNPSYLTHLQEGGKP